MFEDVDFKRYKYYLTHEPKIEKDRVELYSTVYKNYIFKITQDFTSDQEWSLFYRSLHYFIYQVSINFGKTRLSNYILYNFNIDREEYFNLN